MQLIPEAIASRPVFTGGHRTYAWADVIEAARLLGVWPRLEQETRAGLAAVRRTGEQGEEVDRAAVEAAATAFRYARRLLSGDEIQAWLDHWGIGVPSLREYLTRSLLRERWRNELDAMIERYPVGQSDIDLALWGEAVCSGQLERSARSLAGDVALAIAARTGSGDDADLTLSAVLAAAERVRTAEASSDAIERAVGAHRLEWQRFEGQTFAVETADIAHEARLRVREDGEGVATVAAEAGSQARAFRLYQAELDDDLAAMLASVDEGDLAGPRLRDGRFELYLLSRRAPATSADPDVRQKAVDWLVARTTERAIAAHVEWHEHV